MTEKIIPDASPNETAPGVSRRGFLKLAGASGFASAAGALAGAVYGESGIPARWLDALTVRERVTAVADRLASLASPD